MLSLSSLTSLNTNTVQESEIYVSQARSIKCIWTIWQDLLGWLGHRAFIWGLGLSRTMAHCFSGFGSVPCKLQCKGWLPVPNSMNFRKTSERGGGHFRSEKLCCAFSVKGKRYGHRFPGQKRNIFFRKIIEFGPGRSPLRLLRRLRCFLKNLHYFTRPPVAPVASNINSD